MSAEEVDIENVTKLLEEETEEANYFREEQITRQHSLSPGSGMRHSETTDTLDSVYLDPPALETNPDMEHENLQPETRPEQVMHSEELVTRVGDNVNSNTKIFIGEDEICALVEEGAKGDVGQEQPVFEAQNNDDLLFSVEGIEITGAVGESPPSLSKYFGKDTSSDDPFATNIFENIVERVDSFPEKQSFDVDVKTDMKPSGESLLLDIANEMTDLTLDDSKDLLEDEGIDVRDKYENHLNHARKSEELNVDFELALDKNEPVETPVDIEEKDDFESFTAYAADTEALDALGMSPAAPSYMTEKNISSYFRQTSQTESVKSLGTGRQVSRTSARSSSIEPGSVPESFEEESDNYTIPAHVDKSESSLPAPEITKAQAMESKQSGSVESTPSHQPMFPPSTTLSPVDSPLHQPTFNKTLEHQTSISSIPPSPEHRVTAFQNTADSVDDPFSVSLQMSDTDRQHDAWLPSEATKKILFSKATHTPGTYRIDSEQLCSPSLVITESQGDPVKDLVFRYMGEQEALKRQVLTANKVSQDTDGLKKLMSTGCYRSAIDLTGKLLGDIGQAEQRETPTFHTPESLQIWHCRFSLMMKLRMYSVLESECAAFKNMDTPDIYYEFYPLQFPGKRGSMVSFGMRLLHAELPHHLGRSTETLDRLYYMLAIAKKIIKNLEEGLAEDGSAVTVSNESRKVSIELWEERERRILYSVANILISLRDYDAALSVYETLLEMDIPHQTALLSGLGRIHLQIGNLAKATEYFQRVEQEERNSTPSTSTNTTRYMNKGFVAMCQNNFSEAYQSFKQAVEADPSNTSAVNNMAVCCLYLGRLKDALKSLEALVHGNPDRNLHEGILFNLCTLYELESSRALHKKQALLDLVSKHKGDGFPVVCLKMA